MSFKKIVIGALICAALLLYITKVELAKDDEVRSRQQPLIEHSPRAISRIEVRSASNHYALVNSAPDPDAEVAPGGDVSLSASEVAKWSIEGVSDSVLDRGAVNNLIAALRAVKLENELPASEVEADLSVYGLKEPGVSVSVTLKKPADVEFTRVFQLGKLNEYIQKRYIKEASSSGIYLINDDLVTATDKKSDDFRDKTPVEFDSTELRSLRVSPASGQEILLIQRDGEWDIKAPRELPANRFVVDGILRELRNLQVKRFIDGAADRKTEFGLATPFLTVELESGDSTTASSRILFGRTGDAAKGTLINYFSLEGRGSIYEISFDPTTRFVKSLLDWRDKKIIKVDTESVTGVQLAVNGRQNLVLVRDGKDWRVGEKPADTPFIEEFLSAVSTVEAIDFIDTEDIGYFASPNAQIKLSLNKDGVPADKPGSKSEINITIGKLLDKPLVGYAARIEGQPQIYVISADSYKRITPSLETLLPVEKAGNSEVAASPGEP